MKSFFVISLILLTMQSHGQSFDMYSIQELDSIKRHAVYIADYTLADNAKREISRRVNYTHAKDSLYQILNNCIAAENYSAAADIQALIHQYSELDSLRLQLRTAIRQEKFNEASEIKKQIVYLENLLDKSSSHPVTPEDIYIAEVASIDTLFYDADWFGVSSYEECTYYRIVKLDNERLIVNPVCDYFKNGQLEGVGYASSIDFANDARSVWSGLVEVYDNYGNVKFRKDYSIMLGSVFVDGNEILYYMHNGIIIAVSLDVSQLYGKYFSVYIYIANYNENSFLFDPEEIEVLLSKSGQILLSRVIPHEEFMKKISNRQAWNSALIAWNEASMAQNAGYSYNSFSAVGIGASFGQSESLYSIGAVSGSSSSYNGSEAYQARQVARQNVSNFNYSQSQIKETINQEYLKKNTVFGMYSISGMVNIKYTKADYIYLQIPVNGYTYTYKWSL